MDQADPTPEPPRPDRATGDVDFDAYAASAEDGETPLLGHLVLYSVFDGDIAPADLEDWFNELGLDENLLPPQPRNVDAFEKVTGLHGVRRSYPLDDPTATGQDGRRRRRRPEEFGRSAVLMIRPVRSDSGRIVRHIVREVRDEKNTTLSYDTRLGTCVFHRDQAGTSTDKGAGRLSVQPDEQAIAALPEAEQSAVREMVQAIATDYGRRSNYLSGDKLRSLVRRYVEHLGAIKVRSTGGVYFVHHRHAATLAALRELVGRFAPGSHLVRIPIPNQDEMREMVIAAFATKAKQELDQLGVDIAAARRSTKTEEAAKLLARFKALKEATAEHSALLSTSLDDTEEALRVVNAQLATLIMHAG